MGKQNRVDLKNQFSTGKVPTQGNYENIIDSFINIEDADIQIIKGGISSSALEIGAHLGGHITASGNISASGTILASEFNGDLSASFVVGPFHQDLIVNADISASGHMNVIGYISASGGISASGTSSAEYFQMNSGYITASFISASGDIYGSTIYGTIGTSATITTLGVQTLFNVNGPTQITGSVIELVPSTHVRVTGSMGVSGDVNTMNNVSASILSSSNGIATSGDINAYGHIKAVGPNSSGSFIHVTSSFIKMDNTTGTSNNVVVLSDENQLVTDAIDSRVWGTTLLDTDGTGTNNELAIFKDANTVEGSANLTFDGSNLISAGNITAGGTVLGTKGIYTAINDSAQVVTWEDSGDITAQDFNNLHLKVEIRSMPVISPNKYNTTTEWMRIKHGAITAQSILIANSDNQGLTSAVSSHVGMHFFNVGNGFAYFRFSNLAGESIIPQGETTRFNIMILSR